MQFGLCITGNDPAGMDAKERVTNHVDRAICARDCGFDMITVGNRYSFGPATSDARGAALTVSQFMPLPLLAHIAGYLGADVKYATTVLVSSPLHPVQLAEDVATLDALCGGGLRVGIGLGWQPYELEAFGIQKSTRVRRFEELVTVLRELMTSDSVTFEGDFFTVNNARLVARGIQRPCPPIWLGASTDAAVRRAARLGDTWVISAHHGVRELKSQLAIYQEQLSMLNRPLPQERPIYRNIYIDKDRKNAFAEAEPIFAEMYRKRGASGWFLAEDQKWESSDLDEVPFIIGDPSDCIEQIAHIEKSIDANIVIIGMPHGTSQEARIRATKLFSKEVMPHFRKPVS